MTGTGVAQGLRGRRPRALVARPAEGLRRLRPQLGLRQLAPAPRRRPLRAGAPRHEDRRPVVPGRHRRRHRQEPLPRRASHDGADRVARRLHHPHPRAPGRGGRDRGHGRRRGDGPRPATGRSCGAPRASTRTNDPLPASWRRRWPLGDVVVAPTRVKPMLVLRAFGSGDVTKSGLLWSFDRGPDVPTPATDGTLLYVVTDNGLLSCLDLATGKVHYGPQRLRVGTYSSSPLARRRQALRDERGRAHERGQGRPLLRAPGRERARRLHGQLSGRRCGPALHPHARPPVRDRWLGLPHGRPLSGPRR